ncbi:MAG: Gfo/Idh/MocA family oxidoreductase [Prolixibacteraceae bacterium]|jgi:predicted dehydrogenase|nr:Gfo/Idh/MocA family oxidoreductase [Prolixibacteraceae bacterium]
MKRRNFIALTGATAAGSLLNSPSWAQPSKNGAKKRLALVGTGDRGSTFWGRRVQADYGDIVEFVGLCDVNPGRAGYAKDLIKTNCPIFTDFDEMMNKAKPDMVIVTTVDATHHIYIIKALEYGAEVLTEKPLTTDETKLKQILDAELKSGIKVKVGFNYRYGTIFSELKKLLAAHRVGQVTSVDFHWYLNVFHGADYFRRWHGHRANSGTLLVHKASHHFDLLNWMIDSDPVEVNAYGMLEHYGKNNKFRGNNCRNCPHTKECKFYWDMTKNSHYMKLYAENEKYDGYLRDNCLWRGSIDIFDKMAVQIKYANGVQVSYSVTTYSPYEGWRIAFNGKSGRIDASEGIPYNRKSTADQAALHLQEMSQKATEVNDDEEIVVMDNFGEFQRIEVPVSRSGHGGGDSRLQDKIFRNPGMEDPFKHAAGTRDGAMACLIGFAARRSIDECRTVKISELTDIKPNVDRS